MPSFLKSGEALLGLAMVLIGLGFFAATFSIEVLSEGAAPRVFPMAAAILIIVLGGIQMLAAAPRANSEASAQATQLLGLFSLSVAYVTAITHVGYLVSTALAAPIALWLFGIRSKSGLLLSVIICPAIYHLIFFKALGVFPPYGLWFDLLDVIKGY